MIDTIVALSSGAPPAAIAVVRLSGPRAHEALEALAGPLLPPRHLALRAIRDPGTGALLDRGLVVLFSGEASVTGEPLAELHLHGGRATIDAVLSAIIGGGLARPARAGEFTWRAFENGKLDLLQVESLSDLLRAETEAQRRAALAGDGLSRDVERWRGALLELSARVEAALDQSDEDDVPADRQAIDRLADSLIGEIEIVLARPGSERLFDGIRVVVAGPPNSGKSSLINALVGRDVAIVSPIAGTTRDVIEAPVQIAGIAFVLTDTAGLRPDSNDEVEREGIARAERRLAEADLIVWLDDSPPPSSFRNRIILIHPRCDEEGRAYVPTDRLPVSSQTRQGLAALQRLLVEQAATLLPREGEAALTRRQRSHIAEIHADLSAFASEADELLGAEHLRTARQSLDALTGRAGTEDMLDALFGTFCIGK